MMKLSWALLSVSLLVLGCSARDGFEAKLRSLRTGMDAKQAQAVLGSPTKVFTRTNTFGAWPVGTSEWWEYAGGTTDGQVYFDEHRQISRVYGHAGPISLRH